MDMHKDWRWAEESICPGCKTKNKSSDTCLQIQECGKCGAKYGKISQEARLTIDHQNKVARQKAKDKYQMNKMLEART